MKYTKQQIDEYNKYRNTHIKHRNECPMCRGDTRFLSLTIRECIHCINKSGEGYPVHNPKKPITIEEFYN